MQHQGQVVRWAGARLQRPAEGKPRTSTKACGAPTMGTVTIGRGSSSHCTQCWRRNQPGQRWSVEAQGRTAKLSVVRTQPRHTEKVTA